MDKLLAILICGLFLVPDTVYAYVGPGAGLSLLGALWALILAIGTAIVFVVVWPIRKMRRRRREAEADKAQERGAQKQETKAPDARERTDERQRDAPSAAPQPSAVPQNNPDRSRRR